MVWYDTGLTHLDGSIKISNYLDTHLFEKHPEGYSFGLVSLGPLLLLSVTFWEDYIFCFRIKGRNIPQYCHK